jgi:flagella basal body P-ring formation protein FlgA
MSIASKTRQRFASALLRRAAARLPLGPLVPVVPLALLGLLAVQERARAAVEDTTEAIANLEALARTEAASGLPALGAHQRLAVGPLDARFAPERCTGPIQASPGLGAHPRDRITIELRCAAPRWHLYVPVRVIGTSQVLLAAHAIVAGSVLKEEDFRVEQRDLQELPPGYMDEPRATLGLTASRPIASGAVITNQMLIGERVVQRGQNVTLIADASGLSVRMAGRALTDGMVNQRVRVQNLSSGKVVEGIARSDQVVEIISR